MVRTKTTTTSANAAVKEAPKAKKAPAVKQKKEGKVPLAHGVGRRKAAIARTWLTRGSGALIVNGKDFKDYFDNDITRTNAYFPFTIATKAATMCDVAVNVYGGGLSAQADAIALGISRALVVYNEELRPELRKHGLLTVDSRVKERKKPGQKAARRKFQFVKR